VKIGRLAYSDFITLPVADKIIRESDESFLATIQRTIVKTAKLPRDETINETWKITFDDGISGLFKPGEQFGWPYTNWPERSYVSYKIDRLFQIYLIPPTAFFEFDTGGGPKRGSIMLWIEDAKTPATLGLTHGDRPDELKLLDALIGNADRKEMDWLIGVDGRVHAIDNDSTFKHTVTVRNTNLAVWEHELAAIENEAKRKLFLSKLNSVDLSHLQADLALLDEHHRDRFTDSFDLIVNKLTAEI
jgi:hypothetical protein